MTLAYRDRLDGITPDEYAGKEEPRNDRGHRIEFGQPRHDDRRPGQRQTLRMRRSAALADFDDPVLGPLRLMPGSWKNTEELKGFGFNMMALPFRGSPNGFKILMNQHNS